MRLRLGWVAASAVMVAAAVACSSSSSGSPAAGGGGSEAGASSDDSGAVGPVSDASVEASTVAPIQCGSTTCSAPTGGAFPLSPCCLSGDKCGATFGIPDVSTFDAAALAGFDASALAGFDAAAYAGFDASAFCLDTSAGTPDTSCPSQTAMGFTLAGCCSASGVCGVNLSVAGLGCNDLSVFGGFGATGDAAPAGPPQPCGAGTTGDAAPGDAALGD
jgi:hypothetical protein